MNSSNQASFLTNCLQGHDSELKLKNLIHNIFHIPLFSYSRNDAAEDSD